MIAEKVKSENKERLNLEIFKGSERFLQSKIYCVYRPANACLRMRPYGRKRSKTLENE